MSGSVLRRRTGIAVRAVRGSMHRLTGGTRRRLKRHEGLIPILMYHRVCPDDPQRAEIEPGMYVSASTFERHVRWLTRRFRLVTLSEAVDAVRRNRAGGLAVITFDDGWRDNLTQAWPVMERYGARATIFLVADWIRGLSERAGDFLSSEDVRFLFRHGIELGAHTVSHPKLDELSPERIERELQASKSAVAKWTGAPCRTFAYPFGRYSEAAVAAASRTFDASVRVGGGWWGPTEPLAKLPRISIHDDVTRWVPMFEARLAGIL